MHEYDPPAKCICLWTCRLEHIRQHYRNDYNHKRPSWIVDVLVEEAPIQPKQTNGKQLPHQAGLTPQQDTTLAMAKARKVNTNENMAEWTHAHANTTTTSSAMENVVDGMRWPLVACSSCRCDNIIHTYICTYVLLCISSIPKEFTTDTLLNHH